MLTLGKLVPDAKVDDLTGRPASLWDYRQKSHVVLVNDPSGASFESCRKAVLADASHWDWLNVAFLRLLEAEKEYPAGSMPSTAMAACSSNYSRGFQLYGFRSDPGLL